MMTTRKEVAKILTAFKVHWPNMAEPNEDTFTAFHDVLQDIDFETLNMAAKQVISEPRAFAPSAGELRDVAFALVTPEVPPALEAWGIVKEAMLKFGHTKDVTGLAYVENMNPLAARAARALGWRDFGLSDIDDEASWRARFIECYNTYTKRQAERERELPAITEFKMRRLEISQAEKYLAKSLTAPVK